LHWISLYRSFPKNWTSEQDSPPDVSQRDCGKAVPLPQLQAGEPLAPFLRNGEQGGGAFPRLSAAGGKCPAWEPLERQEPSGGLDSSCPLFDRRETGYLTAVEKVILQFLGKLWISLYS
jgi:hypothetical protein